MKNNRNENRRKWTVALVIAICLFVGSLIFTFITTIYSEWLPFYFCWGDMILVGVIFIILLNLMVGDSLPDTTGWGEGAAGGLLLAITAFTLFALMPSRYSDPSGQMMELGCFGMLGALVAFVFGAGLRRYSILLVAGASFFIWTILIPFEVIALSLTVVCLVAAGIFIYWLNGAYPPIKAESEYVKIEDVFDDPDLIKSLKDGHGWSPNVADPDVAMAQLERMAQAELSSATTEDELPEWLMETEPQQEDVFYKDPFPQDAFQEKSVLDKSSPAFLWIFVLLLILLLFALTFLAIFVR